MINNKKKLRRSFLGLKSLQIGVLLFIVIMLFFFSDSNIMKRIDSDREIKSLKKQVEFYRKKTEEDKAKLYELQSDKDNLEKFARENYLMKKENEEVFIIE
ncbi:MAG TPA: septum formation initiator family protein [Dysgonamonadaceae bacterium]|nr:septum formation initiator family protein [Dysgonamonadaceae bacterium]